MNRIIYLLKKDDKEIAMLFQSLRLLRENFLPNNNYPIVILHDEEIDSVIFDEIKNYSGVDFQTILISFDTDEYKSRTIGVPENIMVPGVDRGFGIGYRHMCRLYSYGMYEIPELQDTNYYLRLDCDSYFVTPVDFDLFKVMESGDKVYGYNAITTDNPLVSQGLWEVSKEYSKTHTVLKTPIDQVKQYNVYYTNFEIAKFDWFANSGYKDFFSFLDNENGIYKWRWGDHCIKYLGVEMFLEDNKKQYFSLPSYRHGNIYNLHDFKQFINR